MPETLRMEKGRRAGCMHACEQALPWPAAPKPSSAGLGLDRAILPLVAPQRAARIRAQELVDLPRAPLPDPEIPAPVRFLPIWDAILLAHARRTQILPDEHRGKVFNPKTPQSMATFTVDGRVAGTWRYEKGKVRTEPFGTPRRRRPARARRRGGAPRRAARLSA